MENYIRISIPNPEVLVEILLSDSFFQLPGSVDRSYIEDVKEFLHFVDRTESDFSISNYPFVIDILYSKGIDDLTIFDLEDIEYVLEEIARHYGVLEF